MALNRRQFLEAGTLGAATTVLTAVSRPAILPTRTLCMALLHLAPRPGDLGYNRRLVETAVTTAAGMGAAWILTPELCISGYAFADQIGTDWIVPQPDPWMRDFCQLVARLHVTVFLSHPERDPQTATLHNSVFMIAPDGTILGTHRKINTLRIGAEAWSSPGDRVATIPVEPFHRVGILICADAYSRGIAQSLQAQGAQPYFQGLKLQVHFWRRATYDEIGQHGRSTAASGSNQTLPGRVLCPPAGNSHPHPEARL